MKDEPIKIWYLGNTGVRNPLRLQDGLKAYAESDLMGKITGVQGSVSLMRYLNEQGILNNDEAKDDTGSYGRKWRLMWRKHGFTYNKAEGYCQEELGPLDYITPFGRTFIEADTVPAIQECFLRAMSMHMFEMDEAGKYFSPLRWTLAVLLKVEERTGSPDVSFVEFAAMIQTSDPSHNIDEVVDDILKIREAREKSTAKKLFNKKVYAEIGKNYNKKNDNFKEYADMNLRYLRASGIFQRKGRGIAIVKEKHILAERLASELISEESNLLRWKTLCEGRATLPTDDKDLALQVVYDLKRELDVKGITFDEDLMTHIDVSSSQDINNVRHSLEDRLAKYNEVVYAENQREQWKEIYDYMTLVSKRGGSKKYADDIEIKVPKDEVAAYLEWTTWRSFLAIDSLKNQPYEARHFRIDQDYFPVNTAPGNGSDLLIELDKYVFVIEVTMSESSRQEAMEGEPVRRHVADIVQDEKYKGKEVYGIFIANHVNINTYETFRLGSWYTPDEQKLLLNIVPFTIEQYNALFKAIFENNKVSDEVVAGLLKQCVENKNNLDAIEWKNSLVETMENYNQVLAS